ncbi:MAG: hypothetical protein ACI4CT_06165 [Lachnospiraceae bacterium]
MIKKALAFLLSAVLSVQMAAPGFVQAEIVNDIGKVTTASVVSGMDMGTSELVHYDDVFQYHYAGGTDEFNAGISTTGKAYDTYLWVPSNVSPGKLKGLVAVKLNLIEVPFVYSAKLKEALTEKGFGILFIVFHGDDMRYNTTFQNFNTRLDYKGETLYQETDTINNNPVFTTDGKDAADIFDEMLSGIANASGYKEIADSTPLITIGHSAASPFGYRSGNWNPDRIIAQVQMKNGMGAPIYVSNKGMVPGIPSLQYAAQYTEHALNTDRDRSVRDARWHISNQRSVNTNMLVSHVIEWGSGHYDWSDNATDMMISYIRKAIEYRLPENYAETGKLNDLTGTGYLAKPFEKDKDGNEQIAGYYRDTLKGWLTSGQEEETASTTDKKASFWYFDQEIEEKMNTFTNYAIPESPDSKGTGVSGKTYSEKEPYMLMKDPSKSTYADTPYTANSLIAPYVSFNGGMSRYGSNRFVNYLKMKAPDGDASNSANLQGYGEVTVDTYYMNKVPAVSTEAYENVGESVAYPEGIQAPFVPLISPYEYVSSELLDMSEMTKDDSNSEAANVASVTRTTLRFHNNRVYYASGQESFGFIYAPEVSDDNGEVVSTFKATGVGMKVPYVTGRTAQTLTLNNIENVNISEATENPKFGVTYTSSDAVLQDYTDVFVEYGPAKAIRTVDEDTGAYSWQIEVLLDEIPENASYPIEVNVVASNLGAWEKVNGATISQTFLISEEDIKSGVYLDGTQQVDYDTAFTNATSDVEKEHVITVYSDQTTSVCSNMSSSEIIRFTNDTRKATVTQTSSNMMFLNTSGATNPQLSFGNPDATMTDGKTALWFDANGKQRFVEANKGSVNLYHGVVITSGSAARGGAIDCKTGSTVNLYGGIIKGNTATNSDSTNLGGGAISAVGSGKLNMYDGLITGNTSTGSYGGGVSVMENSTFHMSGGKIINNEGYDVYVGSSTSNFYMSGTAEVGEVYLSSGKVIQVESDFTTDGSHAQIVPAEYTEGTTVVTYVDGITPDKNDFTVASQETTTDDVTTTTPYYLYVDGQDLKLTTTAPVTYTVSKSNVQVSATTVEEGDTVTVTLPEDYVANSLLATYTNSDSENRTLALTKVNDTTYTFMAPAADVQVSCLVNEATDSVVIVGTTSTYYVKSDNTLDVSFTVPEIAEGYVYQDVSIYVPVRAHPYNAQNMTATMGEASFAISSGTVDDTQTAESAGIIAGQTATLTITNEKTSGVDYYYGDAKYGAVTASNFAIMTLTIAEGLPYYSVDSTNVTVSADRVHSGDTVTITTPDTYVANSLLATYRNSSNQVEILSLTQEDSNTYTFTAPAANVTVSALVNEETDKVVVVGETDTFYVRSDNSLHVNYSVPEPKDGYGYLTAEIYVPVRDHAYNATNMTASMGDMFYTVTSGVVSGSVMASGITPGATNTLTINNENANGVDYYYKGQAGCRPETASDLAILTLSLAEDYICEALVDGVSFQGAQIRTQSENQGLRFVSLIKRQLKEKTELPDSVKSIEYGNLLIPQIAFDNSTSGLTELDMTAVEEGITCTVNEQEIIVKAAKVQSTVDYENDAALEYVKFASLLRVGSNTSVYKQNFVVRPYLIYRDSNGNQVGDIVYAKQESRNMHDIARETLQGDKSQYSDDELEYLNAVAAD